MKIKNLISLFFILFLNVFLIGCASVKKIKHGQEEENSKEKFEENNIIELQEEEESYVLGKDGDDLLREK